MTYLLTMLVVPFILYLVLRAMHWVLGCAIPDRIKLLFARCVLHCNHMPIALRRWALDAICYRFNHLLPRG